MADELISQAQFPPVAAHEDCMASIADVLNSLRHAEDELRASSDAFEKSVGRFGSDPRTHTYMAARYKAVNVMLQFSSEGDYEGILEHCMDMLRLSRMDEFHVRDIVPNLLMLLECEQECYDFIKWWSIALSQKQDLNDLARPYLNLKGANVFERISKLDLGSLSLCNLATLTLLKVKIRLDLSAFEDDDYLLFDSDYSGSSLDRPICDLVRKKLRNSESFNGLKALANLEKDYGKLCGLIEGANPYFWDLMASDSKLDQVQRSQCLPGSKNEAVMARHLCKTAWEESEDAELMIEAETVKFAKIYNSPAHVAGLEKKRGTGRAFPSLFTSEKSPADVFVPTRLDDSQSRRFVHGQDEKKALVYVDGACSNNGQQDPRAAWAVVYGPPQPDQGHVSGRLETLGPFDQQFTATSNRAELRAVIAALRMCDWTYSQFNTLVIATDSAYVVDGTTKWAKGWVEKNWKLTGGGKVRNRDLWELLLWEAERWDLLGLKVELWKIPREVNTAADKAAKDACEQPTVTNFSDATVASPRSTTAKPRILALALETAQPLHDTYLYRVAPMAEMRIATSEEAAVLMLAQESPPPVIIAADAALFGRKTLSERVIDNVRRGATLIVTGASVSLAPPNSFNQLCVKMGLAGTYSAYTRANVTLQKDVVGDSLAPKLRAEYRMKAVFLKDMPKSAMWYVSDDDPALSSVVLAPLGQGKVGFIGDVTEDEATLIAFEAMCDL
ncbi:rnase h domain protein [Ophiostoma piceae UAMH 11346]|uniref:ribonuclease H n=1 Tax=Ophiostoma piceae (strain UAMH 11346) TaxID=1262450 RepID=S3BZ94_OPHP1|nr:rnase h domain protein [Ophiostoma piceae UAMH 11346]